jgi:replicative DNA helicase
MSDLSSVKISTDLLPETEKLLSSRGEKPEMQLLNLQELDRKVWGIHRQKCLVIGARPSNLKTATALNVALTLAEQNFKVYFVSLEQPSTRLQERLFCMRHNVDNIELLKGGINTIPGIRSKWADFSFAKFHENLIISDMIGRDFRDIDEVIKSMGGAPDVLIIDHLHEIGGQGEQKGFIDRYIEKARASCIKNNYALILCSQVNRMAAAGEGTREPQLHQLKGSGNIEQCADQVWLLHWEYHYGYKEEIKNEFQVHVAKNRDGSTGYIKLRVIPEYYQLSDWSGISDTDKKILDGEAQNLHRGHGKDFGNIKTVSWND